MENFLGSVFSSVFDPLLQTQASSPPRSRASPDSRLPSKKLDPELEVFVRACKKGDIVTVGTMLAEGRIDPSAEGTTTVFNPLISQKICLSKPLLLSANTKWFPCYSSIRGWIPLWIIIKSLR